MTTVQVLGIPLTAQRFDEAIERLLVARGPGEQLRAHFATVHSVVEATKNPELRRVFATAAMVCTDGMPIVWVARLRGAQSARRVCGPEVMLALCDRRRAHGLRHYFLGGREGTLEVLAQNPAHRFPGLPVVGTYAPRSAR